jgi:hypothetical protein
MTIEKFPRVMFPFSLSPEQCSLSHRPADDHQTHFLGAHSFLASICLLFAVSSGLEYLHTRFWSLSFGFVTFFFCYLLLYFVLYIIYIIQ